MVDFVDEKNQEVTVIKIIGVGGAGGNAVNSMVDNAFNGLEFIVANTDAGSLRKSNAQFKLQLGRRLTHGQGAGAKPEVGREAALESQDEIRSALQDTDMVIIAAGMGKGTGTGASPVIASIARDMGILTLGIVTMPFDSEGVQRRVNAEEGLRKLREHVDSLIIIPNEKLKQHYSNCSIIEAFMKSDAVLCDTCRAISDIIHTTGYQDVDFADLRTVVNNMGYAIMGFGSAEGENRAVEAAKGAISNPLLSDISLTGCKAVLVNVYGGYDMQMSEYDAIQSVVITETGQEANIITGLIINEGNNGKVAVTILATGLNQDLGLEMAPPAAPAISATVTPMPELLFRNDEEKHDQLDIIFERLRQNDSLNLEVSREQEVLSQKSLTTDKYDIPAFMRKFTD
jgi:cell division protein FtsZ